MQPPRKPHCPHNNRRAIFHDYQAPCNYMITISKAKECPPFSYLVGNPKVLDEDPPRTVLSCVGRIIDEQIRSINAMPQFAVCNYVVMPDHVHILWHVACRLPKDVGFYVGLFKARCSKIWREQQGMPIGSGEPVFAPKYNDRIAYTEDLFHRFHRYIADNPRRRLMVMRYPELFDRRQSVRINGREMDVYGNFQLLRHPVISAVVVSSRYTEEERRAHENEWDETIRAGGVLVSPFISKAEKKVMLRGMEEGASIIRIIPEGIEQKYKPSGREFDLCAEGRCLHIGALRSSAHKADLHRAVCMELNDMARWLAANADSGMVLVSKNNNVSGQ